MTDIVSTRVIDAHPDRVYQAFIDPDRLARWWGPEGFTNTFHEFDPRPGGTWTWVMHGPDGTDYELANEFVELVPVERIVIQHLQDGHRFRLTITLADATGPARPLQRAWLFSSLLHTALVALLYGIEGAEVAIVTRTADRAAAVASGL